MCISVQCTHSVCQKQWAAWYAQEKDMSHNLNAPITIPLHQGATIPNATWFKVLLKIKVGPLSRILAKPALRGSQKAESKSSGV